MNPHLVHSQPQVLGECARVPLQDIKDGGAIERPLLDEGHVRLIALLFRQVCVVLVFAGNVFWPHPLPQMLGDEPLNYSPKVVSKNKRMSCSTWTLWGSGNRVLIGSVLISGSSRVAFRVKYIMLKLSYRCGLEEQKLAEQERTTLLPYT